MEPYIRKVRADEIKVGDKITGWIVSMINPSCDWHPPNIILGELEKRHPDGFTLVLRNWYYADEIVEIET
jgi:intein/homing endonuclease